MHSANDVKYNPNPKHSVKWNN